MARLVYRLSSDEVIHKYRDGVRVDSSTFRLGVSGDWILRELNELGSDLDYATSRNEIELNTLATENEALHARVAELEEALHQAERYINFVTLDGSDYENLTAPTDDTEPVEVVQPLDSDPYPNADVLTSKFRGSWHWCIYLCGWDNATNGQAADYWNDDTTTLHTIEEARDAGIAFLAKLRREATTESEHDA